MEYEPVMTLYKNIYGKIIKVTHVKTNQPYVYKIIYNHHGLSYEAVKESILLQQLNHPHIIKLYQCHYELKKTTLLLEYADMDLKYYMNNYDNNDNVKNIKNITLQICLGLKYCHDMNIIHRDIKPQNILVQIKSYGIHVKIADFGLAIQQLLPKNLSLNIVSLWYRAPEILLDFNYDCKIDIWALGCVFYELSTKSVLFPGTPETQLKVILHELHKINKVDKFVKKMLKLNPDKRFTAEQLLEDDYFLNL